VVSEGAVDACRATHLRGVIALRAAGGLRCCWSLLGRVHVENEAVAADEGARIAGGKRVANALAGHSALRVSILDVEIAGVLRMCSWRHNELMSRYLAADTRLGGCGEMRYALLV
jgi:hypothetical protein